MQDLVIDLVIRKTSNSKLHKLEAVTSGGKKFLDRFDDIGRVEGGMQKIADMADKEGLVVYTDLMPVAPDLPEDHKCDDEEA